MDFPHPLLGAPESVEKIRARASRARRYAVTVLAHYPESAERVQEYARELDELASQLEAMPSHRPPGSS